MSAQGSDHSPSESPRRAIHGAVRRRALRLGLINGAVWSIGNGLSTGSLMYYLAQELGAQGTAVSLLIAAPSLIGLLRLVTPRLIEPLGGVKAACLKMLLAAYVLLSLGLPGITLLGADARQAMLAALITLVCMHQLLEYIGSVALWSWLGALVPPRIRGRYFGRRNLWQMAVLIPTLLASGAFTDHWKRAHTAEPGQVLLGYIIPTTLGGCCLLASLLPLVLMPDCAIARRRAGGAVVAAFADRRFGRLLVYRGWFSFFNGLTQAAQTIYVRRVLNLDLLTMQSLQLGMRAGQVVISPVAGAASDRFGNRPVLELSQALVSAGLLFFAIATPGARWWIVGAYVLWSAYAGINICLTNVMLKLAPPRDNAGHIAVFEALGGLAFGLSTIAGGVLFDRLSAADYSLSIGAFRLDYFALLFIGGAIARTVGVFWLTRIDEPSARTWREILRLRR